VSRLRSRVRKLGTLRAITSAKDPEDWTERLRIDPRLSEAGIKATRPLLTKRINEYDQHIVDLSVILQVDSEPWPDGTYQLFLYDDSGRLIEVHRLFPNVGIDRLEGQILEYYYMEEVARADLVFDLEEQFDL
jgi:hypothetical protein